jgi:hypothetical protein
MFEAAAYAQKSVLTEAVSYENVASCNYALLDAGSAQQKPELLIYPDDVWEMWNVDQGCSVLYAGTGAELWMYQYADTGAELWFPLQTFAYQ